MDADRGQVRLRSIRGFEIVPSCREFSRLLGARRDAGSRIAVFFERAAELAGGLWCPAAVFGLIESERLDGLEMPSAMTEGASAMVVAAVTIGSDLEKRVAELSGMGKLSDAVILDAFGSALAEGAADEVERQICEEAAARGLGARRRRSPGYGSWRIEAQQALFDILGGQLVGIELGGSMLMSPRKSVSFAVPLGSDFSPRRKPGAQGKCLECEASDCTMRER